MKKAAVASIIVAVVLLAVAVIAEAQQPKKMPRIGYVAGSDPSSLVSLVEVLIQSGASRGRSTDKLYSVF
jgi:hypothetical protein